MAVQLIVLVQRMRTVVLELLLLKLLQLKLVANKLTLTVLRVRRSRVRCGVRVRSELRAKAAVHAAADAAVGLIEVGNIGHVMHIIAATASRHARAVVEKGQTRIRIELRLEQASELLLVDRRQRQRVCNHALVR